MAIIPALAELRTYFVQMVFARTNLVLFAGAGFWSKCEQFPL
jgi:hypothetical protein